MFFKKTFLKMSQNFKTIRQLIGNIHPWFMTISYLSKLIWTLSIYRIRAYSIPLLIKPSLQPNLNKPLLFCSKSPLFKAFWGKNQKNFNKPPPKNPQIFINHWRSIGLDTVFQRALKWLPSPHITILGHPLRYLSSVIM